MKYELTIFDTSDRIMTQAVLINEAQYILENGFNCHPIRGGQVNCTRDRFVVCNICDCSVKENVVQYWGDDEKEVCPRCAKVLDNAPQLLEACKLAEERLSRIDGQKDYADEIKRAIKLTEGR